jgi:hypothetical protein
MSVRCLSAAQITTILATLTVALGAWAQRAQSDESGTLVMAGRTNQGIVISVDSEVQEGREKLDSRKSIAAIDQTRKLVDLGKSSSCAMSGFIGLTATGNNLARDIRGWVLQHPNTEISVGSMRDLLTIGVESWNREHYPLAHLPQQRKVGSEIPLFICGGRGFTPGLIIGTTVVTQTGRATIGQVFPTATALYAGGLLNPQILVELILRHKIPAEATKSQRIGLQKVDKDINFDPAAMKALLSILAVNDQINANRRSCSGRYTSR